MDTGDSLARSLIANVLTRWPQTIAVFRKHNMACVGCALAPYYTVSEAVSVYGLSLEEFLGELILAITEGDREADD